MRNGSHCLYFLGNKSEQWDFVWTLNSKSNGISECHITSNVLCTGQITQELVSPRTTRMTRATNNDDSSVVSTCFINQILVQCVHLVLPMWHERAISPLPKSDLTARIVAWNIQCINGLTAAKGLWTQEDFIRKIVLGLFSPAREHF